MMNGLLRRMVRAAIKRRRKSFAAAPAQADTSVSLQTLEPRLLMSFDPTAAEQLMMELLNQFRMDPGGELSRLTSSLGTPARSADSDIDDALVFFGVNGSMLSDQFAALSAVAPLAWNESLMNVAQAHNDAMIAADVQSHEAPGEPPLSGGGLRTRFNDQGYSPISTIGENIFAFAESVLHGHAGFAIDWGDASVGAVGGIQSPAGHRDTMMNANFKEVGIRITPENNGATDVGPLVITQDFGGVVGAQAYLLGVAYNDSDGDAFYDIGEGLGGVSIQVLGINGTGGEFNVASMTAGGWQVQVPAGTYRVTFTGGGLTQTVVHDNVVVTTANVKLDSLGPEINVTGNAVTIVDGDTTPSAADHTSFGNVQLIGTTLTRTYTIHNTGANTLHLAGSPRVSITGVNEAEFTVISQPAATIEPGQSSTFQIRFDPAATGLRTATVNILNDDGDESLYDFAISGVGVAPEIDIRANNVSIADGDTSPSVADFTDFRQVPVSSTGLTSVTRTFTIRNTEATALSLTGSPFVQISGAHASDFTVTTQPVSSTIAGGDAVTFVITFNPSAAGLRTATVTILSDDADEGTYNFDIQGTGIETTTAGNNLQSATLVEGAGAGVTTGQGVRVLYTGYLTTGQQFDSNVGGNPFNFTLGAGSVIAGWDQGVVGMKIGEKRTLVIPANLAYGNNPPANSGIPAGATLIFEIERVAADIAVGSPQGASLIPISSGDVTPSITDHTDMGAITLGGGTVTWTFRITATGALNLTGSPRIALSGAGASAFTVGSIPSTPIVPASGQTTATRDFTITFNPQNIGLHEAVVTILSDDPDEATYTFAIAGTGIANRISGAVEDTDFVISHTMLNGVMRESGTSDYVIEEVVAGTLLKNGVPVVAGVTTISAGQSLTWQPPANANRTTPAFTVRPFIGGVGVGTPELVRVEITPAEDAPIGAINDILLGSGGPSADQTINLASLFSDADINGTVVRISTSLGNIDVHLFNGITPLTVANFMNYANGGDWVNTIIHRVVAGFVVQGGGFKPQLPASHITTDPAVANEFAISSQRGTIAMAKSGNQINSATSEWFFNLGDNATNLDNQNGGFTVFGEVIGNGMNVVDDIATTPLFTDGSTLTALPLRNYSGGAVQDSNWIKVNSVTAIASLSFSIIGNTNPALVTPSLNGASLSLDMSDSVTGTSDITLRATDLTGRTVDVTFTVSIAGVSVTALDSQAAEPVGQQPANTGVFRITRTGSTDAPLTVSYNITGSATSGGDYQALPLIAVIPAGQSFVDVTVDPLADEEAEGIETVQLSLVTSDDYTITGAGAATVSIFDDKPVATVTALDASAAETNSGQAVNGGVFQFSRSGDLSQPLTVHYTITGLAENGVDYELIPQSVVIPAGESSVTLGITPIQDSLSEPAENVTISLAADGAYVVDNDGGDATVLITDNDPTHVQIAVIEGEVSESAPQTPGIVRISRTGAIDSDLTVKFARGGKAKLGPTGDYTLSVGQVNFTATSIVIPAGQAFVDVHISAIDDALPDAGETVSFKLAAGAGYTIPALPADQIVEVAIEDNEPLVTIASTGFTGADASAAENDAGQASDTAFFRISRTGSTAQPLEVKFTLSGVAKINSDFILEIDGVAVTGKTITIPAGQDHVDVVVVPVNDVTVENTEPVVMKLGANTKVYSLPVDKTQHGATVTIADNEPTISVSAAGFSGADASAAETNTGETANTARFRISRTNSGPGILVGFRLSGTAKNKTDYILTVNGQQITGSTLVIPTGASFVDVIVTPVNDALAEPGGPETVTLQLHINSTAYRRDPDPAKLTATVTIADNEPTVSVIAIDAVAAEPGGTGNTGRFRISRTGNTADALEVAFKVAGTAKGGSDYVKLGTKVTIPAGAAFVDIDIEPLVDAVVESPETVTLTLVKSKAYNLDDNATTDAVTIADAEPVVGSPAPTPDLVALSLTSKAATFSLSKLNADLSVSASIKNQGSAATTVPSQVRVMLSKDRTVSAGDIELGLLTLPPLAAGKSATVKGNVNITGLGLTGASVGQYFLILVLDHGDTIIETIESNNLIASQLANITITA